MIHDPENDHIITELWAFCSKDEKGEGLIGKSIGGQWFPFIAADKNRVNSLRSLANQVGKLTQKRIVLKHFKLVGTEEIIK